MQIPDFLLERYFARWEFAVRHVLGASDVEGYAMSDVLALADDETRRLWADLRLGYTESAGHPLLRREIAAGYRGLTADDVLVFSGAQEAIFCLVTAVLQPGDHVIVTWPAYQSLHEVARAAGADVTMHELHEADGWALDPERFLAALRPTTRLAIVNAPHNPTGMLPSHEDWARLTGALAGAGVRLLADEVYRDLEFEVSDRLVAGAETADPAVSLGVMSKALALAGLRIGWLATRDRALLERCAAMKDYTTICAAAPSEILALVALRARERILARSRSIVATNLVHLDRFFDTWSDRFRWVRPRAGSIGFPRLAAPGVSVDKWAAGLVEAEGVLVVPGSQFGHPGDHFRIGFGRTDLPEALGRLEAFAKRTLR